MWVILKGALNIISFNCKTIFFTSCLFKVVSLHFLLPLLLKYKSLYFLKVGTSYFSIFVLRIFNIFISAELAYIKAEKILTLILEFF